MIQNYRQMSRADKVRAAAVMYGTDSKQHRAAIKRFSPAARPAEPTELDVLDSERERMSSYAQCESCGRPDVVIDQVAGLCYDCAWED